VHFSPLEVVVESHLSASPAPLKVQLNDDTDSPRTTLLLLVKDKANANRFHGDRNMIDSVFLSVRFSFSFFAECGNLSIPTGVAVKL